MKISRLVSVILLGVTLIAATPIYAQRGGGGRSGGSSSSSHSSSSSRGGGGSFSSSRGSSSSSSRSSGFSSSSSRSSSSFSHSSSSGRSSSSYGSSSSRSSSNVGTVSHSGSASSYSGSSSFGGVRSNGSASGQGFLGQRSSSRNASRTGSVPTQMRGGQSGTVSTSTGRESANGVRANATGSRGADRVEGPANAGRPTDARAGEGRPTGIAPEPSGGHGGGHPHHHNPYYGDPRYHQIYWDPCPPRPLFWPGFWVYCNSYWYDYHVTDIVLVREYMKETYSMELVEYAISGEYMYALVRDRNGHSYLQIYDKNDKLLAEQQVSRKYIKLEVDPQNGGCWIMKKRNKDALLFLYADGQLLIYEADK